MTKTPNSVNIDKAADFVWRHGRLVDRRRMAHHFFGGDADGVVAAVAAYRNPDGGYGNALESDCRTPASQPESSRLALALLDEVGRLADADLAPLAEWLASVTTPEGGVPFCLPTVAGYPRAPWWEPEGDPPRANVNPTAGLVGFLRKAGLNHPWLEQAEKFCWSVIERPEPLDQYSAHNAVTFLWSLPDDARVVGARQRLLDDLAAGGVIPLDPAAAVPDGDTHTPLQFAPTPDAPCRTAFDDSTIEVFLDHLAAKQQEDGGWPIGWAAPGATAVFDARAAHTINAMLTLRAYGRT
jgi:hypothetical protein